MFRDIIRHYEALPRMPNKKIHSSATSWTNVILEELEARATMEKKEKDIAREEKESERVFQLEKLRITNAAETSSDV
ncbi:hypothetical protein CEXT_670591 [Caerostris extrusa]|uniref:Uncharacterized protein n=1 Tax=Caerostris extrusa TaxID=172846 RepID=A0AAV4RRQ9_CAEEX|nr:hypothetical protein CEXT_670591 [Caerostris extrusa]